MREWTCLALVSLLPACAGESGSADGGFIVDTLSGGALHVINEADGRWVRTAEEAWRLEEDLRIGRLEGEGPDVFGQIRGVIPGADGTIWIMDSQASELRQFDSNGAFLRTVGGPGEGPGEFGSNPCAFAGPDDEIWVESGGRWQRFGPAGELLGGQQVTRSLGCGILAWRGEELAAALARFDPRTQDITAALILHDRSADGTVTARDTVAMPAIPDAPIVAWYEGERRRRSMRLPLAHSPGYFLQNNGVFWVTDGGGAYRFRRQTLEGDTLLVVERAYDPVPVPDSIRTAEIEGLKWDERGYPDDFDPAEVPAVFPPFERIVEAGDGMLWLRRRIEGGRISFDVFDTNGEFLGNVGVPPEYGTFRIHSITKDHIFGVIRDELDVQYAVRVRIVR